MGRGLYRLQVTFVGDIFQILQSIGGAMNREFMRRRKSKYRFGVIIFYEHPYLHMVTLSPAWVTDQCAIVGRFFPQSVFRTTDSLVIPG